MPLVAELTYGQEQRFVDAQDLEALGVSKAEVAGMSSDDARALGQRIHELMVGRTGEREMAFREGLSSLLGGMETNEREAIARLIEYRWCQRLKWAYADVAATPLPVLELCEHFAWSHADLLKTPGQVVRDFLTIFRYEREIAEQKRGQNGDG